MKLLTIEIMSNKVGMLLMEGNQTSYTVINQGKPLSISKDDTTITDHIAFQNKFSEYLQNQNVDKVVLCEGGKDSKKMRVRMEYSILAECEKNLIEYVTYPTGSCTRLINTTYKKETGNEFSEELTKFKLPKYMSKVLAAGWRFIG
jgi:hypothetical protein